MQIARCLRMMRVISVVGAFFAVLVGLGSGNLSAQSCGGVAGLGGALPPCLRPISPVINCIQPNLNGSFTAQWGYVSENSTCCPSYELPIRTEGAPDPFSGDFDPRANFFTPAPIGRGQPATFLPGVNNNAFTTTWNGTPLTWTLRYFTLTPPFFADASVVADGGAIAQFCSVDCAGNPNGTAVVDRCGVCAGNGNSCLGCESENVTTIQLALDSGARDQEALIVNALHRFRRVVGNTGGARRYIIKVRDQASALANQNWVTTWSFPSIVNTCTNTQFCTTVTTSAFTNSYAANSVLLRDLTLDVLSRTERRARLRSQRNAARQMRKQAEGQHQTNLLNASSIPTTSSTCSA